MKDREARQSIESLRISLEYRTLELRLLEGRMDRLMNFLGVEEKRRTPTIIVKKEKASS